MRWKACLSLVAIALVLPVRAQQPPQQDPPPPWRITTPLDPSQQEKRTPDDDDVVRITTNLVQIDAVVTKNNKPVTDLTEDDFEVLEDGKPQLITNFSFNSSLPKSADKSTASTATTKTTGALMPPPPFKPSEPHRTIAFVFDDLGSSAGSVGSVRKQIRKFIEEEMQPNDLVAIIRTGGEVGALQQFTNDKRILLRAIENLRYSAASRVGISIFPSSLDDATVPSGRYESQSFNQSVRALRFILLGMREIPGRKSMILLSENFPMDDAMSSLPSGRMSVSIPTQETIPSIRGGDSMFSNYRGVQRLAELAIRSSVVIYGVDTRGLAPYDMTPLPDMDVGFLSGRSTVLRPVGDEPFRRLATQRHYLQDSRTGQDYLARETGGFLIKNSNNYFKQITEDQSGYYLIGYRPTANTFNRSFHRITVRVKRPGLAVRTRSGFFGMTDEDTRPAQLTSHDRMNMALMSPLGASDIEVHLTALFAAAPKSSSLLRSLIHFSARDLEFTNESGGWHKATLNLAAIVFGDNGNVIEQVTETRSIRVNDKDLDRLRDDGLVYQLDVPLRKPGAYQFRVAVRDVGSSQIGTARQFVEVPDLKKNMLGLSGITVSIEAPANGRNPSVSDLRNAAIRRFPQGSNLWFGYIIYNARTGKANAGAALTAQSRIFQDGKLVYAGQPQPIDLTGQSDVKRIAGGGGVKLGLLPIGEYQLQIVVTDKSSEKGKPRITWQMIDFEIVK